MADGGDVTAKDLQLLTRIGVSPEHGPRVRHAPEQGAELTRALLIVLGNQVALHLHSLERSISGKQMIGVARSGVHTEALRAQIGHLQERIERLEDAARRRVIWRLNDLRARINTMLPSKSDELQRSATEALLARMHEVALRIGLECMPAPHLDLDPDDGAVELTWFDRQNRRTLGVAAFREGDASHSWGVRIHQIANGNASEEANPSDVALGDAMRRFIGG